MALLRIDPQAVTIENRGSDPLNVFRSTLAEYTQALDAGLNHWIGAWAVSNYEGTSQIQDFTGTELPSTPPLDSDADAPTGALFNQQKMQIPSIKGGYIVELFDKTGTRTFHDHVIARGKAGQLSILGVIATLYYGAVESISPNLLECRGPTQGLNYWANFRVNETNYSTGMLKLTATGFVDKNNSGTFRVQQDFQAMFPPNNNIAEFEQGGHGAPEMAVPFTIS